MTPCPALTAVLFDLDGTLFDRDTALQRLASRQYGEFCLARWIRDPAAWQRSFRCWHQRPLPAAEVYAQLAREFALPPLLPQLLRQHLDSHLHEEGPEIPGAAALLARLHGLGLKIAILCPGPERMQRRKLKQLDFEPYVDAVLAAGTPEPAPPAPAILAEALHRLAVPASQALLVSSDRHAGIEAARQLGLRTVLRDSGPHPAAHFCSEALSAIGDYIVARRQCALPHS
jgi:putative hydrolase of the HAD superfamily